MAKNISLLGANYPDVPAVQLPQTGGGTATFYDIQVVDNLNSTSATDALSANQGNVLDGKIAKVNGSLYSSGQSTLKAAVEALFGTLSNGDIVTKLVDYGPRVIVSMYKNNASYGTYIAYGYQSEYLYYGNLIGGTWHHYRLTGSAY